MALIRVFPILFFLVFFFGINLAYAQITSFSANPASIQSGQVTTYLWSSENLGGIKLVFPCVSGIKYYYESGAPLACGSTILDLATNGAYSVSAANLSLSGASVEVKAVPKTAEGIYDESAPSYAPLTIYPVSAIITEFTSNTDTVVSGNDAVFSWNSQYITGVNFNFSCAENVKIFYAGSEVPCGQIAFGTNLAAQSQISVSFSNISQSKKTISVTVIPAMDDGTYDATRSKSVTLVVEPPPPKIPKVYVYSPSLVALSSGETTVISWGGIYISGVNMNITCAYGITASSSADPSQTLPCGTYAFSENLPATSTHALSFKNTVSGIVRVSLKIIPFLENNTYDATLAKEILIDVSRETPPEPVTAPSEPIAEETSNTVSPSESVESQSQTTEVLQPASAPKQEPTPSAQSESSQDVLRGTETNTKPVSKPPENTAADNVNDGTENGSDGIEDGFTYTFVGPLHYGLIHDGDVKALQKILTLEGVYAGAIDGDYFGETQEAVIRFQKKHGLSPLGIVDHDTREKLNELYGSNQPAADMNGVSSEGNSSSGTASDTPRQKNIFIRWGESFISFLRALFSFF